MLTLRRLLSKIPRDSVRRILRLTSGLTLFSYIGIHLTNHALGLISLDVAEAGLRTAVLVWHSWPGTVLLYGAFLIHFVNALWAVYEMRTFRLPPAELLRIVLGFWLPIALIGHVAATRIAFEYFGEPSTYSRVIANLWISGLPGWQMGLLAPGWIHGCLGLHFAFNRRLFYLRHKYILFAIALLLPVLSALGYVSLGRELATNGVVTQAELGYLTSIKVHERLAILQWRDGLMVIYAVILAAIFGARFVRSALERGQRQLISISYPGRSVSVPRGWTVLESSRAFRVPHASMCGGRARCSTCRVRVLEGAIGCPAPDASEAATLRRIGASSDIRLACQLRPSGNISVEPLVLLEQAYVGSRAAHFSDHRDIVVLFCDIRHLVTLPKNQLPQDLMYIQSTCLVELCRAVQAMNGVPISVGSDGICALFGLHYGLKQAARLGLQAAALIEQTMPGLQERLGRAWPAGIEFAVTVHAGRAVIREIAGTAPPIVIAVGEAMEVANDLRKSAGQSATDGKRFTISESIYTIAGITPDSTAKLVLTLPTLSLTVFQSKSVPIPTSYVRAHTRRKRFGELRRIWSG
jgi:adenylate cyclase